MRSDIVGRVQRAIKEGLGIVTGGSTGVDTAAIAAAMKYRGMMRVYLPVPLELYAPLLMARAGAGKCLEHDARLTIATLKDLKARDPSAVVEPHDVTELSPEAFYARNELILQLADEVAAYHLEGNATASKLPAGTLLTVARAHELGKRVDLATYKMS